LIAREIGFDLEVSADHSQDGDVKGVQNALKAGADLNFQVEVLPDRSWFSVVKREHCGS